MAGRVQLQRPVALPVRALDGRSTTVRLPAASTVLDLTAALRGSFPPAQAAPDFNLFLRGAKLLPDAKIGSLSIAPGEFVSLISFSSSIPATPTPLRSTPTPTPSPSAAAAPNPRPQKRKFFTSSWRKIAGVPKKDPAPPPPAAGDPSPAFAASAKKRKFFESSWSGMDVFARVAGLPINDPASPAFYCHGEQPLSPAQMVAHLKQGLGRHGQIKHAREIPGRQASFRPLPSHLSQATKSALDAIGVTRLYSHQAQAIDAGSGGKHVVVATSTSSGKSLCYNVPVLESISTSAACALYVFPTKALAQDQLKTLLDMTSTNHQSNTNKFHVSIYDGDTPFKDRPKIRDKARLLITNPDMLHMSILPSHAQFKRILSNLEYIVIDEAHSYKGAFGCHVALILRRLKRICADVYGTHPKFIFCTATLANPREHVTELAGLDATGVELVDGDGSPCGAKHFLLWNPSVPRGAKERRPSPVQDVSHLFAEMVQHGLRCIAFCKTKKLCEAVLARTREILEENASPELADSVSVYRGGYAADDRRRIEAGLFGGTLRGVAATNALELGIDVGHIDATLHLGFPGSIASFWQQAGRSGRRSKESIAVYVAFEGALDQYFMNFPDKLFGKPVERCHVDSQNQKILGQHLACAAFEKPLCPEHDERHFGSGLRSAMLALKDTGSLMNSKQEAGQSNSAAGEWKYVGPDDKSPPSRAVSIRAIEHDRYKVIDKQGYRVLEEIEESKAFFQVYEGAVYMHQGHSYLVERLDHSSRTAYCRAAADLKYYTKIQDHTEIKILEDEAALPPPTTSSKTGMVRTTTAQANNCKVTTEWVSFDRIWRSNNVFSHTVEVDLPLYSFDTQAAWVSIPQSVRAAVEQMNLGFQAGVHAASHALLSIVPLHMMCSTCDIGTDCADPQPNSKPPDRILLYDKHPGGIGLASQLKLLFGELLVAALQLISTCGCTNVDGCPSCIQSFACGGYNNNLDKAAAVLILKGVIENERLFFYVKDGSHFSAEMMT
ncbi:unnamed protein product [Urochloa decumbens]|uniref:Uncharacterized protein n=1 Tax=Urochloa decumbens TaxID=240449 RepID=A0ABC8VIM1_9POAL